VKADRLRTARAAPRGAAVLERFHAISEAGARNAATALSQIIGRPVHLEVPWARVIPLEEVQSLAGGSKRVVCALSLRVYGEVRGNLLLLFAEDQVPLLLELVVRGGRGTEAGEGHGPGKRGARALCRGVPRLNGLEESALLEVGNILAGAYLNAVSRLLGLSLLPSIPGLALDMVGAVTDFLLIERVPLSETAVVLASEVREPASGLRGDIFFLPDPATLPVLEREAGPK
jgi:chemotaxis protein CheC